MSIILYTYLLTLVLLPFTRSNQPLQVSCLQTFSEFTQSWGGDQCSSACHVVCHGGCEDEYSHELVTGSLFYTDTTPICLAAMFDGTISYSGGSFSIRDGGNTSRFTSSPSHIGVGRSLASNTSQPSWFIEPYERVRFIKEPEDTTVKLGDYLTLTCQVNARARGVITWYNNENEVQWTMTTVDCTGEICRVQHAEKKHAGLWQCKVATTHSGALLSRYSRVTVVYLNSTFVYQPRDLHRAYSDAGGHLTKISSDFTWPLVLPCSVESSPPAKIVWYKNDKVFNVRHAFQYKDGSLYFLSIDDSDTGSYRCTGYNPVTKATTKSGTYWLQRVAEASRPGPEPSSMISASTDSTRIVKPGDTVVITCIARGNPVPSISWSIPESSLQSPRISYPDFARNMIITNIKISDEGVYECTAVNENDYGLGVTFHTKVLVIPFPTFSIVPIDVILDKGDETTFRCGLQGRGSISWLKDGKKVRIVTDKIEMKGNYLVVRDVSADDEGMYQCVGEYLFEDNFVTQASALLSVRTKPEITVNSENLIYENKQSIYIKCTATGFPYPYVTWYKNDDPLVFTDRIKMVDVQTIVIQKADGLDYGFYKCVARNYLGSDSLTRLLNVIAKANVRSLTASDERGYYIAGDKIKLTCVVAGTTNLAITWLKDNFKLIKNYAIVHEENIIELPDYAVTQSVLTVPSCNPGDQGTYRCLVSNYLGKTRSDIRIRVYPAVVAPQLLSGPVNTVLTEEKHMLVTCVFSGAPPPHVFWRIDNQSVEEDGRIYLTSTEDGLTSNLMITDATKADSGNYSCEGRNSAGSTEQGVITISLYYTNGLRNGTNSTLPLLFTVPYLVFMLLLLV